MSRYKYQVDRPLAKDLVNKKVCGVCAGVARHFDVPRILVRVAVVILGFMMPLATVAGYVVAALVMPNRH